MTGAGLDAAAAAAFALSLGAASAQYSDAPAPEKLDAALKKIKGRGLLKEEDIDAAMKEIREEAFRDPALVRGAPYTQPVRRLDDVKAARDFLGETGARQRGAGKSWREGVGDDLMGELRGAALESLAQPNHRNRRRQFGQPLQRAAQCGNRNGDDDQFCAA